MSTEILHLARRADWDAARPSGSYRVSTLGHDLDQVGFVHCSRPEQIAGMAEAVYREVPDELCVLVIDRDAATAAGVQVRDEDGGDGELFPHVYGAIDVRWVREVRPAGFDADGRFHW